MATRRIPGSLRWPDPMNGPWTIRLHFKKIAGREECVGFEIWGGTPTDQDSPSPIPSRALRAADIRKPPFAELVDRSRRDAVQRARATLDSEVPSPFQPEMEDNPPLLPETRDYLHQRLAAFGGGSPGGRPPLYSPEHYADVAAVYREAWTETGKPLVAIVKQWSVSKSAAAKWVAKCRAMDLLPKTGRGVPRIEEES